MFFFSLSSWQLALLILAVIGAATLAGHLAANSVSRPVSIRPSRRTPPSSCTATSAKRLFTSSATVLISTSLVADDTIRGAAGQHDTYGFALDRRNRSSRRGDQISARAQRPHMRSGLPSA
jgi:hypothetical protein